MTATVSVTVPVPNQVRAFLVIKRRNLLWITAAFAFAMAALVVIRHPAPRPDHFADVMLVIFLPTMVSVYLVQVLKHYKDDWNYELSHIAYYAQDKLMVLSLLSRGWFWSWQTVTFPLDSVADVRPEQWRGLPALRITLNKPSRSALAGPLFLIYAEEDRETVNASIMPLLNRFRTA